SSGYSCSVTGFERDVAMAILSENQYIARLNPKPRTRPRIAPFAPQMLPIATKRPPRAAMRTQVLTLFNVLPSFESRAHRGSDRRGTVPAAQSMIRRGPRKGGPNRMAEP